ncbi:MAG: cytochrome c biogenesis protein ResB [Chloroflexi bacterium]|nr:cytochrome c biogenesis protein ResB [Chloroflexota bacterium]
MDRAATTAADAEKGSGENLFASIWQFFTSQRTAVLIIIFIALASLVGALIVQVPADIAQSPADYASWLESMRDKYGALTGVFRLLDIFNIYNSLWYRIGLALLGINIMVCTVNRFPPLWRSLATPRLRLADSYYQTAPHHLAVPTRKGEKLSHVLRGKGYQVRQVREGDSLYVYGDRFGWAKLGSMVGHLGLILVVVGALWTNIGGFEVDAVIPEGNTTPVYPVQHPQQIQIRNDKFVAEFYPDGRPKDFYSDIVLFQGGREVKRGRVRVNESLSYQGITFHQSFYGPAAALEVKNEEGRVLVSDTVALTGNMNGIPYQWLSIPLTDYTVFLSLMPSKESGKERLAILGYKETTGDFSQPDLQLTLQAGEAKNAGGLQFSFEGAKQYTGLRVRRNPGGSLIWTASGLLILGLSIALYFPRRRVWALVTTSRTHLVAIGDRFVDADKELRAIVQGMK